MTEDYLNSKHYLLNPLVVPDWIRYKDDHLYSLLYLKFYKTNPYATSIEFFPMFRKWLIDNYNCYSDGTSYLYFKTEEDLIMCKLKE